MLRYGSRRIRKHLTMRMPKKINNKITKANVVFCSKDMLESDNVFPRGTKGEGTGCPPSIVQGRQNTGSTSFLFFHHQSADIVVAAPWERLSYLDLAESTVDSLPGGTVTGSYKLLSFPFFPARLCYSSAQW